MVGKHEQQRLRSYRASDDLYERAMLTANARGESLAGAIRELLEGYATGPQQRPRRVRGAQVRRRENA